MKHRAFVLVGLLMLLVVTVLAADDDRTPTTRANPPGVPQEGYSLRSPSPPSVPAELEEALKKALDEGNMIEARRIGEVMRTFLPPEPARKVTAEPDLFVRDEAAAAFSPNGPRTTSPSIPAT